MPRYSSTQAHLEARMRAAEKKERKRKMKLEVQNQNILERRKLYAALYDPRPCKGYEDDGKTPCVRYAIPGGFVCLKHGGNERDIRRAALTRLLCLVDPALRVMRKALLSADEAIAVKAAQVILDRAGFGPKATLTLTDEQTDLTKLTREQLRERAQQITDELMKKHDEGPVDPWAMDTGLDSDDPLPDGTKVH